MKLLMPRATRPLLFLLAVVLMTACTDSAVAPAVSPRLVISPQGTVELSVGETLQIEARVENATSAAERELAYSSSAELVAQVSNTGLITAVGPGVATITVASVGSPSLQAGLVVRVSEQLEGAQPAVSITALLDADGDFLTPADVQGRIVVQTSITPAGATHLRVLLDTSVACVIQLQPSDAVRTCAFDTGAFDPVSGEPEFVNGQYHLSAELLGPDGDVVATASGLSVTLTNENRLAATVVSGREASDSVGDVWHAGDLSVRVSPVLYQRSASVLNVILEYATPSGDVLTKSDSNAPFEATFTAAELKGVVDDSLIVSLTSSISGGGEGPEGETGMVRYDAAPPPVGTFLDRDWVGAESRFAELYTPSSQPDRGVGGTRVRFLVGAADQSVTEIVGEGNAVQSGEDLEEAGAGTYKVVAQVCDALQNCAAEVGFVFGVDLVPPEISSVSIVNRAVNPGSTLEVTVVDELSGLSSRPLVASVLLLDANPATPACGAQLEGFKLPGTPANGACVADTVGTLPIPNAAAGYFTYRFAPIDRAGNVGSTLIREVLVDRTAPRVTQLSLPSLFAGGTGNEIELRVTDDLEVTSVEALLVFPAADGLGPAAFPLAAPLAIGERWDDEIVNEFEGVLDLPFIRTLTYAPNGAPATARRTVLVDSVRIRVIDAVGLVATRSQDIPNSALTSTETADPFVDANIDSVTISGSASAICTANCLDGDATSLRADVRVNGPVGFSVPFTEMIFFLSDPAGDVRIVGRGTRSTVTTAHTTHIYSIVIDDFPAGVSGTAEIFAVGVDRLDLEDRPGRGLKTSDLAVPLFER